MLAYLHIYRAHLKQYLAIWLQYRVAMVIWLVGTVIEPTMYLVVWTVVAQAQGGRVAGYGSADFAAYFIALMLVDHLTFTWVMWEYDYIIREGYFSRELLLPIHPIHGDIADNIMYKLLSLSVMLPAALVLTLTFKPVFRPSGLALAAFIPALLLAFGLRFMLGWMVAMSAFWTSRIRAVNSLYYVTEWFFAGRLTPLELLPASLRTVADILPFQWGIAFPVELILGRLTPWQIGRGLAIQSVWLLLVGLALRQVWRRGVRQYAAFGS